MRDWPHSPVHRLAEPGAYIVTAGTYRSEPLGWNGRAQGVVPVLGN
jgi:hypothetical protein